MTSRLRQALLLAALGAFLAAELFMFVPLTLYVGNQAELTTPIWPLLRIWVYPVLFAAALLALLGMLLAASAARRVAVVVAALGLLVWLQANLLLWDYGQLDGTPIDWRAQRWRGWVDLAIWCALLGFAAFADLRKGTFLVRGTLALAGVVALSSAVSLLRVEPRAEDAQGASAELALQQFFRFSRSRNVLHVVADGVQSDIFQRILEDGETGQFIRDSMPGFVVFPNHLGAYPFTHMSVPAILAGRLYRNQQPREEYLDATLGPQATTILNAAAAAGFEVDLALMPGLEHLYARGSADHTYTLRADLPVNPGDSALHEAAMLADLSLFRAAPHLIKPHVYNDQLWLLQRLLTREGQLGLQSFAHNAFLRAMRLRSSAERDAPVYKLMHVAVSHNPMATTPDCRYAGATLPTTRETVTAQARCGLLEIAALFRRMQELGIYDSATIVLMGDHGAWVPPDGLRPQVRADGSVWQVNPEAVAMAIPMFAIKPPRASGPLRQSPAPSWIIDTARTVAAAAAIDGEFEGHNVLELAPDAPRERRFLMYNYDRAEWKGKYLSPIQEYTVEGPILDSASWQMRELYLSKGRVQRQP